MSGLPSLPQEIQREVVRSMVNLIIDTACEKRDKCRLNRQETLTLAHQAVSRILNLRYISKAIAREVMAVCWERFEEILSFPWWHDYWAKDYLERLIVVDCLCGWLRICPDDDFLLLRARKTLKEAATDVLTRPKIVTLGPLLGAAWLKSSIRLIRKRPHTVTSAADSTTSPAFNSMLE